MYKYAFESDFFLSFLYSALHSVKCLHLEVFLKMLFDIFPIIKIFIPAFQEKLYLIMFLLQYRFVCHVDTFSHLNGLTPVESDV